MPSTRVFPYRDRTIRLIDTAGVRKKPTIHGSIAYYASLRALSALARCRHRTARDRHDAGSARARSRLAGIAIEERKGLIIVANKWDLAREQGEYSQAELTEAIYQQMPFARFVPVVFLSALTRRRLGALMPTVMTVADNLDRRIRTAHLNAVIRDAVLAHPPPVIGGKALKIFYCAQVATRPPLFVFHCNDPDLVQPLVRRFLEGVLRATDDWTGIPL